MRSWKPVGVLLALAVAIGVAACGGDDGGGEAGETVELSFLVANSEQAIQPAEALIAAFEQKNPNVKIKLETGPQGSELDNLIKTRLATGEMNDVFVYLAGSLFQALKPESQLQPVNDEEWVKDLDPTYAKTVSANDQVYGAPFGSAFGGGILYNKKVYEKLGLEIPKTWDEFMANNAKVKAAGIDPVIQSYGETWTSQLFVLADYHTVAAAVPGWDEKYTANQVKYSQEPAIEGFRHLEEVNKATQQELRLGEVPARSEHAREGQGRALSGADDHRAEPGDVRPGQDRRRRLLRPTRKRCCRHRNDALAPARCLHPEDDRGRQARGG
jgi:raffinose/stachyose/melibiose transport system substrate-binding protein